MVDEAHRTQEGDLGRKMRDALPNAFLFGMTGTPINGADKNTFYAFGADEDEGGYISRYGFEDSIHSRRQRFEERPELQQRRETAREGQTSSHSFLHERCGMPAVYCPADQGGRIMKKLTVTGGCAAALLMACTSPAASRR